MLRLVSAAAVAACVLLTSLAAAPPADAACVITLPKASISPPAGTLYRNVALTFGAGGTWTKATGCTNQPSATKIVRWEWDWNGDGATDQTTTQSGATASAAHKYTVVQTGLKAQVRVTDDLGNTSPWGFTLFSTVNKPPTAVLSVPAKANRNESVTFSGASSFDQTGDPTPEIRRYHWDIDGNASTTTSATTAKAFALTGRKTIRLRVEDADQGFSDWVSQTIEIGDPPPVISAVSLSTATPLTGQSVAFSASATASAGGLTYRWDFGDGASSTSAAPSHAYALPGARTVTLTVRDQNDATATATRTVNVQDRPPVPAFSCTPLTPWAGELVTCTSTSTDPDDGIASQWWDVDADGTADGFDTSVTLTRAEVGSRAVRLTVTDRSGVGRHVDRQVTFAERRLTAAFAFGPDAPQAGDAVTFDAAASRDPGGPVTRYEWDLDGNGTFETDAGAATTVTRAYAAPGTVTVGLRVTSGAGTATTTRTVTIAARPDPPATGGGGGGGAGTPAGGGAPSGGGDQRAASSAVTAPLVPAVTRALTTRAAKKQPAARKAPKAGACAKLRGRKRSACITRQCKGLKGKKRTACRRTVTKAVRRTTRRHS